MAAASAIVFMVERPQIAVEAGKLSRPVTLIGLCVLVVGITLFIVGVTRW